MTRGWLGAVRGKTKRTAIPAVGARPDALVLDALGHAIWAREHEGHEDLDALVAHIDRGRGTVRQLQPTAYRAGITPSVGAVGSS